VTSGRAEQKERAVPLTTLTFAGLVIAAIYLLGSGLLLRRLTATESPGTSTRRHGRARGLDLLVLPDAVLLPWVGALAGLTGGGREVAQFILPAVALTLWITGPRYVMSKMLPLALVGIGLSGILWAKVNASSWQGPYGFDNYVGLVGPEATLVQAWAFIAAGLLLTWLRMDPHSLPSQLLLREPALVHDHAAGERSRRGRPRWGLALLLLAVLLTERLGSIFGWHPENGLVWIVPMAVIAGAAAVLAFCLPAVAADLAIAGLIAFGLDGIEIARTWSGNARAVDYGLYVVGFSDRWTMLAGAQGVALVAAGIWLLPRALDDRTRSLFRPAADRELAGRVVRLTRTRADAVDSAAAELRRLERDLHDGAQARLVALGIILRGAEGLIHSSPDAAAALVAEARESSLTALGELRDLVRGIRPPVLADRGLADAVRALALDTPLHTQVDVDLPGRPDLAVESACYFAVAELLANAVKHSGARHAHVQISHDDGTLLITVTDDGAGGADPARGTGLSGLERRLATFDGVLAVSSPPGGPTIVAIEVPCALSSLKTSTC
jgi:signal transduction histidine kinase